MGGAVARVKQNNLSISAVRKTLVDWGRLREDVGGFLRAGILPSRNKQPRRCSVEPRSLLHAHLLPQQPPCLRSDPRRLGRRELARSLFLGGEHSSALIW
jgi:hypothetical protein